MLRDQQLVSGKVVTAIHSLYMRSKLGMRGAQKVGQLTDQAALFFSGHLCGASVSVSVCPPGPARVLPLLLTVRLRGALL